MVVVKKNRKVIKNLFWQTYSDGIVSPFSSAVLVMQAAHPDVGAAVARYSVYKEEPWGRLFRTGFSMMRFLYKGRPQQQQREAKDLRHLHSHINGKREDGTVYRALTPSTFRIVPDTFLDGLLRIYQALGCPLTPAEEQQAYEEYLDLCELFGIDRCHLEPNIEAFKSYYEKLLLETMTYNETVAFLLEGMLAHGPKVRFVPLPSSWRAWLYRRFLYPFFRTGTLGFLDPRFREKHKIDWSENDATKYQSLLKWLRRIYRWTPRWLRYHPLSLYVMLGGRGNELISPERLRDHL